MRAAGACSRSWLERYGSPLNVIDPAPLARNAAELAATRPRPRGVDLQIFFARKANKALALVDEAPRSGLGVDVASERELRQVLERGVPAGRHRRDRRRQAARAARAVRRVAARRS